MATALRVARDFLALVIVGVVVIGTIVLTVMAFVRGDASSDAPRDEPAPMCDRYTGDCFEPGEVDGGVP